VTDRNPNPTAAPAATTSSDDDTPTLPIRIRQKPGRHRAPAGTPSTVATWTGGRHFRPAVTR